MRLMGNRNVSTGDLPRLVDEVRRFAPLEPWGTLRVWGYVLSVDGRLTPAGEKVAAELSASGEAKR